MLSVVVARGAARRRGFGRRVRIGAVDPRLTGHAGVAAVTELDRVLGIGQALDAGIGQVKQRRRGCTAGELLVSMASAQLAGAEFLVGMDRRREDHAGQALEPVPTPASTTTVQLAQRFTPTHLAGIEAGIGTVNRRVMALLPENRREQLLVVATIDGDTTDVEVYGRKKQDAVYNYQGQRAYRPHIAFWAEGGTTLAADLMRADEDPRPVAADLLDRAVAALPPGVDKIRCRWDSGYFAVDLARHCVEKGVDFAIGVKHNTAVVRASRVATGAGLASGDRHGAHRGRRHRVPARKVAEGCRHRLHRPAHPDPGRSDPDRPAGPQAPHDRQGPVRRWRWPGSSIRVRVLVHPDQPGRVDPGPAGRGRTLVQAQPGLPGPAPAARPPNTSVTPPAP